MRVALLLLLAGVVATLLFVVGGSGASTERRVPPAAVALASGWRYRADGERLWHEVTVPNDFNPVVSPSGDRGRVGWYEVRFTAPPAAPGRSWSIHFEGVRRTATVWLNGRQIGRHADPYAPFSLPATSLVPGDENTLLVRVDSHRTLPEDWWNWGGITGPVTLEPAGRLSLAGLGVTPELGCRSECGRLIVRGRLVNHTNATLRPTIAVKASAPDGRAYETARPVGAVRARRSRAVAFSLPIQHPALWSPEHPELYQVSVQVETEGAIEQSQSLQTGLRAVQVRHGLLYLNGRRLWLRGAAIHEDMPGEGAALSDGDIDTIVSELRSVGANITRAHYLLSPRLLDALDAAGIMVWEQAPVDHADGMLRTGPGRERALALLRSTLTGDRSHPSVIINSVGNELSPNPEAAPGTLRYLRRAIPLARRADPAALVGLDTYGYPGFPAQAIYAKLGVLGISSYFGWYTGLPHHSVASFARLQPFLRRTHARYPNQALAVSEYGAEGVFAGSANVKGTFAFQTRYLKRTLNVIDRLPFMNGSIYWTLREFAVSPGWRGGTPLPSGFDPDGLHHKGLIAYDGNPKPAFALAEQLLARTPSFVP